MSKISFDSESALSLLLFILKNLFIFVSWQISWRFSKSKSSFIFFVLTTMKFRFFIKFFEILNFFCFFAKIVILSSLIITEISKLLNMLTILRFLIWILKDCNLIIIVFIIVVILRVIFFFMTIIFSVFLKFLNFDELFVFEKINYKLIFFSMSSLLLLMFFSSYVVAAALNE